jgi:hypothetical protein
MTYHSLYPPLQPVISSYRRCGSEDSAFLTRHIGGEARGRYDTSKTTNRRCGSEEKTL